MPNNNLYIIDEPKIGFHITCPHCAKHQMQYIKTVQVRCKYDDCRGNQTTFPHNPAIDNLQTHIDGILKMFQKEKQITILCKPRHKLFAQSIIDRVIQERPRGIPISYPLDPPELVDTFITKIKCPKCKKTFFDDLESAEPQHCVYCGEKNIAKRESRKIKAIQWRLQLNKQLG